MLALDIPHKNVEIGAAGRLISQGKLVLTPPSHTPETITKLLNSCTKVINEVFTNGKVGKLIQLLDHHFSKLGIC